MTDPQSSELISARFDGELAGAEFQQSEQLLAESEAAQRELAEYAVLSQWLRAQPASPVPPTVTQAILQALECAPAPQPRALRGARPAALLAAVLCLGLAGLLIDFGQEPEAEVPGTPASRLALRETGSPEDKTVVTQALPAPARPRLTPQTNLAENIPEPLDVGPLQLSPQVRKLLDDPHDFRELKPGDELPVLESRENQVLVVYLTVVDVERSLDTIQVLLGGPQQVETIPVPSAPGEAKKPEKVPAALRGLYVEANSGKSKILLEKLSATDSIQKILISGATLNPETTISPSATAKATPQPNPSDGVYFQKELTLTRPESLAEIAQRVKLQRDTSPKTISPDSAPPPHRLLFILEQTP